MTWSGYGKQESWKHAAPGRMQPTPTGGFVKGPHSVTRVACLILIMDMSFLTFHPKVDMLHTQFIIFLQTCSPFMIPISANDLSTFPVILATTVESSLNPGCLLCIWSSSPGGYSSISLPNPLLPASSACCCPRPGSRPLSKRSPISPTSFLCTLLVKSF